MTKSQGIIVIIAIIAVIFLFMLPKHVVRDNRQQASKDQPVKPSEEPESHNSEIPSEQLKAIDNLRKNYLAVSQKEKKIIFADSLATLFRKVNRFDSSAKYLGEIALLDSGNKNLIKAGDAYFEAATFSLEPTKAQELAKNALGYFEKALEKEPNNLELKTRMAKALIAEGPENTMKGVVLLKEVVQIDPSNQNALLALGILSLRSGQNDKAIERFQSLLKANPKHAEGEFYLGYAYMKVGDNQKAKESFEKSKTMTKDSTIIGMANQYLNELK